MKLSYRIYKRGGGFWFRFEGFPQSTQGPFGTYEKAEAMAEYCVNAA